MRVTEYTINWIEKDNDTLIASVRFGIFDAKGREMGVIQAQRNGKDFGATTRFRYS